MNGKDGKDGLTFKGANGQDGVDGKNGTNGMTRIVYEDSNKNKHEVATTDDGLKFTGNNESVVNKNKLNSTVKVKGEGVTEEQEKTFESAAGNIAVTADGNDTLNIRLNKNIKGIDSIQTKEIHLGTPDNYTTIKKDGDRIKYGDKTFANTDDIWTIQANGTDVPANGGKVNVKGADGITVSKSANGEMTISGAGLGTMNSFNVKSTGNTTADSETTAKSITDGKTVEFSGGKNLTVKQTSDANGAKVEYALSNNVDLTNKGSVTIGDTKITDGGLVINNGPSVTKDGINAGNKTITGVKAGENDTDAVNVKQLKDSRTTLTSDDQSVVLKKTETADGGLNYDLSVKGAVDPRVDQLNEEIGRVGAQGAALSALKPMQYDPLEPTQIMAGYGNYRGNSAIAVGVAHYKNESTMFHGGLSWAGGSSHMMANAGVTWKVGNRDSEAAVADRYRKGPISSAYAVQTEMAAMKAQNAGLKGEVSDLKYENEQIKAQNAGLQSEVEVLKAQMAAMMARLGM